MKKYLAIFIALVVVVGVATTVVRAAQLDCYGTTSTDRENGLSTQSRLAQQYIPAQDTILESISFNIYGGGPGDVGDFLVQIQETTAGLPNGTIVTGSLGSKPSNVVPDVPTGIGQAFKCSEQPTINHTINFSGSPALNGGQMYALIIYHTTGSHASTVGWVQNNEGAVPLAGLDCIGVNCPIHLGWALTTYLGDNFDTFFSVQDLFIDPGDDGVADDGKIDSHIQTLRNYTKLSGDQGGLIFGVIVMSIVFIMAVKFQVPFIVAALFNTFLMGALARAEIMPPWILLAVIAVGGIALVFKLAGIGGQSDEG